MYKLPFLVLILMGYLGYSQQVTKQYTINVMGSTTITNSNYHRDVFQQNNGDNNTNIGTVNGPVIVNSGSNVAQTATIKIEVNTKSIVYKDGDSLGIADIRKPLKIQLKQGQYEFEVKSIFLDGAILDQTLVVEKALLGTESYVRFYFTIDKYLTPVHLMRNGKYGYLNFKSKELVINLKYDRAGYFYGNITTVGSPGHWGFIDQNGKSLTEFNYGGSLFHFDGFFEVFNDRKCGLINLSGKEILPPVYDGIGIFEDDLALVDSNDKYGFINKDGKFVVPLKYSKVSHFSAGYAKVAVGGTTVFLYDDTGASDEDKHIGAKWGLIDESGREVLPPIYDRIIYKFQPHLIGSDGKSSFRVGVKRNDKWNFVTTKIRKCDLSSFEDMREINYNVTLVTMNGKKGTIDSYCNELIPIQYKYIGNFLDHLAPVVNYDNKVAFFNEEGKQITDFKYWAVTEFNNGFAKVRLRPDKQCAFINTTGKELTPFKYDCTIDEKYNNMAFGNCQVVKLNGKLGLIDPFGKEVTAIEYDNARFEQPDYSEYWTDLVPPDEGDIGVLEKQGKCGYFDRNGRQLTEVKYEFAGLFQNTNIALVVINGKYGCIDKTGAVVIPLIYDDLTVRKDNIAEAIVGDKVIYFNEKGECVFNCL